MDLGLDIPSSHFPNISTYGTLASSRIFIVNVCVHILALNDIVSTHQLQGLHVNFTEKIVSFTEKSVILTEDSINVTEKKCINFT